ncbi:heparinase II/III domain-containing protein [Plantibacter sp. YIM 135347]|uniref:heparinase II/III domain-containing protein n=1 Tax=Plantibacter sp. YIM 135347 TaxID=3423919 RepID=UPI003D3578E7
MIVAAAGARGAGAGIGADAGAGVGTRGGTGADAVARVDALVTALRGGWWHDYACPTHGTELLAARGEVFPCEYGCELQGEPFASAWVVYEHQAAARRARLLAHRSVATGSPADRDEAAAIVAEFASVYASLVGDGWNAGAEAWMLQGKLFKQALTEAIWAVQLADAVSVLGRSGVSFGAPVVSMLGSLLDTIIAARQVLVEDRGDPMSNYVAWLDAAGSLLVRALDDLGRTSLIPADAERGVWLDRVGAHAAIAVRDDGWEWEGSTYYHLFVLRAYLLALADVDPAAVPTETVTRLRSMVDVLARFAGPDGTLPMLHDGPYDRVGVHLEVLEICVLAGQFWADPALDSVEARVRELLGETFDGLEDLLGGWFGGGAVDAHTSSPHASDARASTLFADVGYAVLRDADDAFQAVLDAGPHGGSHGHLDTLALYLTGDGVAWQPAPGVPPYGNALRHGHYRRTLAHPTIRVDELDQLESTGVVESWRADGITSRVVASSDAAIPGVELRRFVEILDGGIVVDVFRAVVLDGTERRITLALRPAVPFAVTAVDEGWRTRWSGGGASDHGPTLHGVHRTSSPATLLASPGRGPSDDPAALQLVGDWTAIASDVTFVSVYATADADASPIASVEVWEDAESAAGLVRVILTDGRILEGGSPS